MPIYDAAMKYRGRHAADRDGRQGIRHRLVARLGGERHALLGVKAVIAESFERIHRSNLVGMGVIPLQFTGGDSRESLGIKGDEIVTIEGFEGRSNRARP